MKKMFCLLIAFVMIFVICSCNDTLPSNDSNTYSSTKSSENTDNIIDDGTKEDNSVNTIQIKKYYKEISSSYTTDTDGVVWENDQIFLDGVFEMKQESQYKVISSETELEMFTLLKCDEIEENIFENNYIVAILHYYEGPSVGAEFWAGFYNADFNNNHTIDLDKGRYPQATSTDDIRDVYRLHFIVVPKTEINVSDGVQRISINENKLEEYPIEVYDIPNITEEITAYYVPNEDAKNNISKLDTINVYQFPYIVIHLNKRIQTDYMVKDFQYTNGEIFITIEIFEKREMEYLHEHSTNLIIAILPKRTLGEEIKNIPAECKVNVVFKKIVSVN